MKYCAFLRGVNVKGTAMKMADVCNVFEKSGLRNIMPVLATGNIIFTSDKNREELKEILEKAMSEYFNYDAFLFIKNENEVSQILNNNPFPKSDDSHIYVFITSENMAGLLLEEFSKAEKSDNEKAEIVDQTFFWQVEKGHTLASEFGKILGKKAFKDKITSRNINTFERIVNKF